MSACCASCGGDNVEPRYRACPECRAVWRAKKGLSYEKKTISVAEHKAALAERDAQIEQMRGLLERWLGLANRGHVKDVDGLPYNTLAIYEESVATLAHKGGR